MAISFVGASLVGGGTSGVTVPSWPAGIADGDVALLLVECANDTVEIPGGWNLLVDPNDGTISNPGTGTAGAASSTKLAVYWRRLNSGDGAIGSLDALAANHIIAAILAYRDVESVGLCFDDIAMDVEASSTTAVAFPAVTTTVAGCRIVNAGSDTTDSTSATRVGSWTNANLSGLTERLDGGNGSGNGGGVWAADGELASAGSSGSTTATLASASEQARVTIALRPAGSYSPPSGPTVSIATGGVSSNATSFSVALPATVNAGDVLCVAMAVDGSPTLTWDNSTAGTWTERVNTGTTGSVRLAVFTKTADGTEDGLTLSISSSASEAGSWAVYRIQGVTGSIELSAVTQFSSSTTRHIRPAAQLTPSWGKTNTLWAGFAATDAAQVITHSPPMFTTANTSSQTGSGGAAVNHSYLAYDAVAMDWGGVYLGAAEDFVAVLMAFEPAAAGDYTITADGGSFSETRQPASLLRGRLLTAEGGTFNQTGQDASLAWTQILGADLGAFSLTGQTAALQKGFEVAADAGSFAVNGQDADLDVGSLVTATTWSVMANMTLSNGDLTVTGNGGGLSGNARSFARLSGKHYVELAYSNAGSNVPACGVANSSENNAPGVDDNNSISWSTQFGSGGVFLNSVNQGSIGLWSTTTDVLCIAVDYPNQLVWMRKNNGAWNGSGTANPATGLGGIDISALGGGDYYIYAFVAAQTYAVTSNFGGSAYTYTAPAGFGVLADVEPSMTAQGGSFGLNGQPASLSYSGAMTAAAGAFSLGGQDAMLLKGSRVYAQPITHGASGLVFTQVPRQANFPGTPSDWITIDGKYAYQGNRNTVDFPPEVDWPLRVSDRGNVHRIEVRKGDRGWSGDDVNSVNRSEVVFLDKLAFDTDYVISFSMLIENTERTQATSFHMLGQLHHNPDEDDTFPSPPFQMTYAASDGNINFHHMTSTADPLTSAPPYVFLGFVPATPGQWMHFQIEARIDPFGGGHYRVWANDVQKVNYSGGTGYNDAEGPRWQYGTYRSATDQTFVVQYANMEWSAGAALAGRRSSPLPIDDVWLEAGRLLTADVGSHALAGQTAELVTARTLPLAFGQFALSGQDLSFRFSRIFQADAGAVVLQGQDTTLIKAEPVRRVLLADAAAFLMAGKADLRGPPWMSVAPAPASWTATPENPETWTLVAVNPESWTPQ